MLHKVKDKMWHDHRGNQVPVEYVPNLDKKTEVVVSRLIKKAMTLSKKIADFKTEAYADCDKLYAEMLANANIAPSERKGNYTITSFDKSTKFEVNVSERIQFNDNIEFAQLKFAEYKALKLKGADPEVAEIVDRAFKTKKGQLDTKKILDLFSYKITHPIWLEGLELVKKAIYTNSSVRYMDIWVKDDEGQYIPVKLNFSTI